jgi:preprotein translocase subunit SecE
MARTRQQAKQRKAKRLEQERKAQAQGTTGQKPPSNPAEEAVVRQAEAYEVADVLEESGGDVDEATDRLEVELSDEAIAPVEAPPPLEAPPPRTATTTRERTRRKQRPAEDGGDGRGGGRKGRRGGGDGRGRPSPKARPERRKEPRQRGRVLTFFVQVWAELRRVQWPDRTQVTQATGVVIVFCLLAGLYLAFFDWVFAKLVKAIL